MWDIFVFEFYLTSEQQESEGYCSDNFYFQSVIIQVCLAYLQTLLPCFTVTMKIGGKVTLLMAVNMSDNVSVVKKKKWVMLLKKWKLHAHLKDNLLLLVSFPHVFEAACDISYNTCAVQHAKKINAICFVFRYKFLTLQIAPYYWVIHKCFSIWKNTIKNDNIHLFIEWYLPPFCQERLSLK